MQKMLVCKIMARIIYKKCPQCGKLQIFWSLDGLLEECDKKTPTCAEIYAQKALDEYERFKNEH